MGPYLGYGVHLVYVHIIDIHMYVHIAALDLGLLKGSQCKWESLLQGFVGHVGSDRRLPAAPRDPSCVAELTMLAMQVLAVWR